MKRWIAIVSCTASLAGCGTHLGDNYGRRTRTALDSQIQAGGEGNRAIDGEDAKAVLQRHRGLTKDPAQGQQPRPGAIIVPTMTSSGSSGSGAQTRDIPAPGSIRLDAVR